MVASRLQFIEPMKAASVPPPPLNGQWLYELKFDGFRILAIKNGRQVELWSRNQKLLNERFPEIATAVAALPTKSCMLDGEVCALNDQGKSSFQLLQNQQGSPAPVVYYVFDLLFSGTKDLRDLPLTERKSRLDTLMETTQSPLLPSLYFTENPQQVLDTMREAGAEGSIAKLLTSHYETGRRSGAWIKIKFHKGQEFVIVGYTLPKNSRKYFGSLCLGYYQGSRLVFAGRVGTGFTEKTLREISSRLKPLEVAEPLVEDIREPSGRWRPHGWKASENRWVKPQLVAQVQFTEWTSDGVLRHPSFLGLREDKKPTEVVREEK